MPWPKEISPNPLLSSTVEIRFTSKINDNDVLNTFYPIFSKSFPRLQDSNVPREIRKQVALVSTPDYVLSNADYSLSVAKDLVSFENVGTYHLWDNYFPMIKENLNHLSKAKIVTNVTRIGVRYASMFEGYNDRTSTVLANDLTIPFPGYEQKLKVYQTNLIKEDLRLFLQIIPDAKSHVANSSVKTGFYIDIDASYEAKGQLNIGDDVFKIIDRLHSEEKNMFFSLLRKEFIETLKPKY